MQLSLAKSADGWCVRCTASESSNEHRVHYRHVEDHTRRRRSLCFSGKWEVIRSSSTQQPLTLLAPSVHRYFSTSPSFAPFLICCAPVVRLRTALLLPSHLWNSTYSECSDWTSVLPCVLQHSGCVTDCHCRHCVPIRYSYRGHQTKLVFSNCFALFLCFFPFYLSLTAASLLPLFDVIQLLLITNHIVENFAVVATNCKTTHSWVSTCAQTTVFWFALFWAQASER